MTDKYLLARYVTEKSQAAFAELSERHMSMVYATCRRDLMDQQLAEDATQMVFLLLAAKAPALGKSVSIPGWLFITARNVSRGMLRIEQRRKFYEREAAMAMDTSNERAWSEIEPSLNDALLALKGSDRDIVLKRFFRGLSIRELAGETGIAEDTAAKRLSRAIERLRSYFRAQGVAITPAALAASLLEHAVSPVPRHVAASVCQAPQLVSLTKESLSAKAHSPYSALAKGLLAMSTTKIAGGIALVVLVALFGTIALLHFHHSSSIKDNRLVQWVAPPAADASTQTAQQQIQAHYLEYMEAWNSNSAPKILAELSPDFTWVNPGGGKTTLQDFARFLPNALATATPGRSTTVKITSCRVSGNTAVLAVREFHHSSASDKPFDGDTDTITVTMVDTGGEWLISRIAS